MPSDRYVWQVHILEMTPIVCCFVRLNDSMLNIKLFPPKQHVATVAISSISNSFLHLNVPIHNHGIIVYLNK